MLEKLEREELLYQHILVWDIEEKFGDEFTYQNDHGNMAIDQRVSLALREDGDEPGRQQNY